MVRYYVTCERSCLVVLAKRLLYCNECFRYNGCRTIEFTIPEDDVRWIKGTLETIERRSKKLNTIYEVEKYNVVE